MSTADSFGTAHPASRDAVPSAAPRRAAPGTGGQFLVGGFGFIGSTQESSGMKSQASSL